MLIVPELKKEPTNDSIVDNNELRDYESGINNSEMENCSNDGRIIGHNQKVKNFRPRFEFSLFQTWDWI